jgi:type VI secretion system protein ImpF
VLRHSILDRLSQSDSVGSDDPRIGFRDLLQSVRRDLEWLLNSKRLALGELEQFPEAKSSILSYGLPDFSHFSGASLGDRQLVCGLITETLKRFEPRLAPNSIRVEHVVDKEKLGLQARFRIHGLLHVDPIKEPVVFDTEIEMDTGSVQIKTEN